MIDLIRAYLRQREATQRPGTYTRTAQICRDLLREFPGADPPGQDEITRAVSAWRSARLSSRTINYRLQVLRAIIGPERSASIKWPMQRPQVKRPGTIGAYTQADVCRIIPTLSEPFLSVFKFLIYTGARKGEVRALTVGDVDLAAGSIKIQNLKTEGGAGETFRFVPILNSEIRDILAGRTSGKNLDDPVFPEIREMGEDWMLDSLRAGCRRAGVKFRRLHGTRHTYISYLLNIRNVPLRAVMSLAGHSQAKTTMRYSHMTQAQIFNSIGGEIKF